jgi:hypothetical protein
VKLKLKSALGIFGLALLLYASIEGAGRYLKSAAANCDERVLKEETNPEGWTITWIQRRCGMLYGGPFIVVKLGRAGLLGTLLGGSEIIEIQTDSINLLPLVRIDDTTVKVERIPRGLEFDAMASFKGRKVLVVEQ